MASFDPLKRLLFRDNERLELGRKALKAVEYILDHRERLVTYDDLIDAIWERERSGKSDNDVQKVVRPACEALVSEGHAFIENRRGEGYLFMPLEVDSAPMARVAGSQLAEIAPRTQMPSPERRKDMAVTPAGLFQRRVLFSYRGGQAHSIRLWGAGDSYISTDQLEVEYDHKSYVIPVSLREHAEGRLRYLEAVAAEKNKKFFNGPCVRLIHWHHNQSGPAEQHTLKLVLGPVGWYDYEGTNGFIRQENLQWDSYREHVDLQLLYEGDVENGCRLSNILGNNITVFTRDGEVGYQLRGHRQSAVPGLLSAAADENVNRYLDEVHRDNFSRLLNSPLAVSSHLDQDRDSLPTGIPHPLSAVRRGIASEWSQEVVKHIVPCGIKVTGLAFGLDILHTDLLWIVLVDLTSQEFTKMCHEHPGNESDEGQVEFVPASFDSDITQQILGRSDWFASGQASVIRAIELVRDYKSDARPEEVFALLAAAHSEHSPAASPP